MKSLRETYWDTMGHLTDYDLRYFHQVERMRYPMQEDDLRRFKWFAERKVDGFQLDEYNTFAYENLLRWVHGDSGMKADHPLRDEVVEGNLKRGIYLAGATGTGKSIALELMRIYAMVRGFRVKFPARPEANRQEIPLGWVARPADQIVADFLETQSLQKYKQCSILCIEDLGREQVEAVAMGNRLNVLQSILEYRGDQTCQLTLITSNYSLDNPELEKRYGERVVSRLYGMCNYFELDGPDRRKL